MILRHTLLSQMAHRLEASLAGAVIYREFASTSCVDCSGNVKRVMEALHALILAHPRLLVATATMTGSLEHGAILMVALLRLSLQHLLTLIAHCNK